MPNSVSKGNVSMYTVLVHLTKYTPASYWIPPSHSFLPTLSLRLHSVLRTQYVLLLLLQLLHPPNGPSTAVQLLNARDITSMQLCKGLNCHVGGRATPRDVGSQLNCLQFQGTM